MDKKLEKVTGFSDTIAIVVIRAMFGVWAGSVIFAQTGSWSLGMLTGYLTYRFEVLVGNSGRR